MSRLVRFALVALAFGGATLVQAQTPFIGLHTEHALPSEVARMEATQRDFVQFLAAHRANIPHIPAMTVFQGDDLTYTTVVPMKDLNGLTGVYADLEGLAAGPDGARFQEIFARGWKAISHYEEAVLRYDAEHSYRPAKPRRAESDLGFFRIDLYFLKPGTEAEAMAVAKEFRELSKKRNVEMAYDLYWSVVGTELPLLAVRAGGTDQTDWLAANAAFLSAVGEEGRALFARAFALSRKIEHHDTWARPDLSLPATGR